MIEHCVSYLKRKGEERAYHIYVTDALKALTKNTATHKDAVYLTQRYVEIIDSSKHEETRSEDEIVEHIKRKIRGQK